MQIVEFFFIYLISVFGGFFKLTTAGEHHS